VAKTASLTSDLIHRGATLRRVRIIGPDGEFIMADMPLEAAVRGSRRALRQLWQSAASFNQRLTLQVEVRHHRIMTKPARFKQSDVTRFFKGAQKAGVELSRD
jgi:hypothetical protein